MLKLKFKDNKGVNWIQVNKVTAKKAFYQNKDVCLCSSNFAPFGFWNSGIIINTHDYDNIFPPYNELFDRYCDNFQIYNCINTETGKYIRFYVKE